MSIYVNSALYGEGNPHHIATGLRLTPAKKAGTWYSIYLPATRKG